MINVRNLEFSYPKHLVFSGINIQLEEGKIYGLLGENGVGKTTLLKILAGLLKSSNGECTVDGVNPFKRTPEYLQNIFFVPEDFPIPSSSIKRFVDSIAPFYPNYNATLLNDLLKDFDLDSSKEFTKLSMGQAKKAFISVALSLQTKFLLMDEPTNGLDIPSKAELRKVISRASTENNTIIISTHQVKDLENLIDPIIILDSEGILLNASIEEITNKLYFSVETIADKDALYAEPTLGGVSEVRPNNENIESKVDLEILFDAAITNKEKFIELFK